MAYKLNIFQRDYLYWIYPLVILGLIFLANKCEKDEEEPVTVIDKDGNLYTSVTIGTQVWMTENLKTTKYNDDSSIPKVTDGTAWSTLATDAYCWYDNDSSTYKSTYGALYNWYAVNTGKLCPAGWHIPTDAEWTILTTFLGGEGVAGSKLKETGTTHWTSPNADATNESGFTALAGGYRQFGGPFYLIGMYAVFWSASQLDANRSWYRDMSYERNYVYRGSTNLTSGFSIRCLKN
jgi:uncharacterized protein (TIGR02145 family)